MNSYHTPVLLKEVTNLLRVEKDKKYIDATLGGGGHSEAIIEAGGTVLGIDIDAQALEYVRKTYNNRKLTLVKGNFRDINQIARLNGIGNVSGVLFDLGVSSHQIDSPERGFSFLKSGPLDMRMDTTSQITADTLVNLLSKGELNEIFNNLGEDYHFRSISKSIASTRKVKAIKTTDDLVKVIARAYGIRDESLSDYTKNLVAKKAFQALRIAVNDELENIRLALPQALEVLEKNGRIAVISFHSLEDRIVKTSFKNFEKQNMGKIITEKPVTPTFEEIQKNPRAKSSKLRVFEKN